MIGLLVGLERALTHPRPTYAAFIRARLVPTHTISHFNPAPSPIRTPRGAVGGGRSGGALFVRAGGRQTTAGCANIARLGKSAIVMSSAERHGARRAAQAPPAPENSTASSLRLGMPVERSAQRVILGLIDDVCGR